MKIGDLCYQCKNSYLKQDTNSQYVTCDICKYTISGVCEEYCNIKNSHTICKDNKIIKE